MNEYIEKGNKGLITSAIRIVVVMIVVGIVGFLGYKYYAENTKKDEKIEVQNMQVNLQYGEPYQINLDKKVEGKITWTSNNTSLVSVDEKGTISINSNEDGTVIVKGRNKENQEVVSVIVEVEKVEEATRVSGISLDKESITLKYGESGKLIASINPKDATNKEVIWTSSNPDLVSVDEEGNIITNKNETGGVL